MIRPFVLILLTTISVQGQDSTLVKEFCNSMRQFSQTNDINSQLLRLGDMVERYIERNPVTGNNSVQDRLRFQYHLLRDMKKRCPSYSVGRIGLIPKSVLDLEDKFGKDEIDSLNALASEINKDGKAYVYIVTIDDFYPDSSIDEFSNRYRDFWSPRVSPEKGVVLVVFSTAQRQLRISTGDVSMRHLTDEESSEVIKLMVPYLKDGRYFDGLVAGLREIKSRL